MKCLEQTNRAYSAIVKFLSLFFTFKLTLKKGSVVQNVSRIKITAKKGKFPKTRS